MGSCQGVVEPASKSGSVCWHDGAPCDFAFQVTYADGPGNHGVTKSYMMAPAIGGSSGFSKSWSYLGCWSFGQRPQGNLPQGEPAKAVRDA